MSHETSGHLVDVRADVTDFSRMIATSCPVCGDRAATSEYIVREQMIGTNEPFPYAQCGGCGARRLQHIPADLSPYYPPSYIAFDSRELRGWRAQLRRFR